MSEAPQLPRGLYAITPDLGWPLPQLLDAVRTVIKGGARTVQYRTKLNDPARREAQATELLALCRRHACPLIINDDVLLARRIGADGVHIGKDDGAVATARKLLGPNKIIGVSCYNALTIAREQALAGADYLAFGSFFPSATKPRAVRADTALLRQAQALNRPMVAIGGISPENAQALIDAGAHAVATINALFLDSEPGRQAERFAALFD